MSDRKRPNPVDESSPNHKKLREAPSPAEQIARQKAQIAEKLAQVKAKMMSRNAATGASRPDLPSTGLPSRPPSGLPSRPPRPPARNIPGDTRSDAHADSRSHARTDTRDGPSARANNTPGPAPASSTQPTAIHPLLLSDAVPVVQSNRYRPMVPKFASTQANAKASQLRPSVSVLSTKPALEILAPEPVPRDSPYYDARIGSHVGKSHMGTGHRQLRFNKRGKYEQKAEALRAEARLEELKRRIEEKSARNGIAEELERQMKLIQKAPPPAVEWWDAPYLGVGDEPRAERGAEGEGEEGERQGGDGANAPPPTPPSYASFSLQACLDAGLITPYVQHPVPVPAPQDVRKTAEAKLYLTKKEMKKKRKRERMEKLRDKQDRIKMGLLPPDPPKVKLSNMMRVLTQDAVADPTKIEARVRREMAARERGHLRANDERKLTDEARREKREEKRAKDESKGIHAICYRVRYLSNPSHRFKVYKNARDDGLTGIIVHNSKFCLVFVEGGFKGVRHYRRLMEHRIDWTDSGDVGEAATEAGSAEKLPADAEAEPINALEEPPSLADNKCTVIWEGQQKDRIFDKLIQTTCPTDHLAKQALTSKLESLWDVAKNAEKMENDMISM